MAIEDTQLISKIVTEDTQTTVGEGERLSLGGGIQLGWVMLFQNLKLLTTSPWL